MPPFEGKGTPGVPFALAGLPVGPALEQLGFVLLVGDSVEVDVLQLEGHADGRDLHIGNQGYLLDTTTPYMLWGDECRIRCRSHL